MSDQGYRPRGWLWRLLWGVAMRFASHVSHLLLCLGLASPAALPDPPKVRLPAGPVVPSPMPNPESPLTLADDTVMVCDSDVECVVLTSPRGLLRVTAEKGPMRVRGKFVDGTGQVESRTFQGPWLYFIEPVAAGRCELLVIPVGGREADVLRRSIVCQVGPQPPPIPPDPKPPDPKPPDPKPPDPKPADSFRVIFVVESGATPPAGQVAVSDAKVVWDYLTANCTKEAGVPGFRRYDPQQKTDNEQPVMRALWAAVKPKLTTIPCLVVERDGKADILPYPATADECLATLKRYREGK